jgi:hypothetical protein
MPYDLTSDYWLYDRYAGLAAERYDAFLIGDSVIWGQYVKRGETLSHYLNERAGRERFANLGLDGAHPAALAGLVEHYAGPVHGKKVVLLFNPLWIADAKHDLQEKEEFRFNHPELVPQFFPRIPCYNPNCWPPWQDTSERLGKVIDRNVPFSGWTSHLQQAYFHQQSIPAWTMEHPYDNPLDRFQKGLPPSPDVAHSKPIPWNRRPRAERIPPQNFPWVDLERSFQWRSFQRAVEILQGRRNQVFVLVGPFNEHLLTQASLKRYEQVKKGVEAWLKEKGLSYAIPRALPSEEYGDASHPLAAGYARLAAELMDRPFFK